MLRSGSRGENAERAAAREGRGNIRTGALGGTPRRRQAAAGSADDDRDGKATANAAAAALCKCREDACSDAERDDEYDARKE
mmetsp:Transcript_42424/g.128739  ORF Transcript_42424/g.128739 Transcript_42424/m.128739 type:complete len:82 (-) Transcript_42424:549-794(-)